MHRSRNYYRMLVFAPMVGAVMLLAGCVPGVEKPAGPLPQSTMEAARLASARHWTVRVISFDRDTTVGSVSLEPDHIRVGSRSFTPGEIYVIQRRVGSTHTAGKTVASIVLTSIGCVLVGELWRSVAQPGEYVAPAAKFAVGGAGAGLAIGVFSQYGTEESRWEEWWRQ
jgi:hypothetical protein